MTFEMGEETRQVQGMWDISTYNYLINGAGLRLLVDSMKEKKIRGIKCPQCQAVYVPGPTFCRKCYIDIDEVVEVADTGVVMAYTVEMSDVRGNPLDNPRLSAMIKLDGADTWIIGTIAGFDWKDAKVGMKVKTIWVNEPVGSLADIDRFEVIQE
ncbi:MAG: hypothetical protein CVT63_03310 [Candidatus Anoxymicrobium japonicum]|uniref:ChsH2 C-terminal OB-fold domain-containing protein n=1 Tax=Candidatus Anoxymicrobium japonicum TaxID=2013648 RepID=A0A2N3G6U8_9ACTN|nr:MAG: hypothetical protein CVT63_03310 [Candidatus Anoxymicrobium japonicum]